MESGHDLLRFGPFRVDALQRLWRGDQLVDLAARPLMVLRYLAERPGQIVTKQELLRELWAGTYVTRAVLKVAVRTVREALGEDARAPQYIETVGWEGYRFLAPLLPTIAPVSSSKFQVPSSETQHSILSPQHSVVVGRESELAQLHSWLEKALQGQRQLVFVTGEPGIGKTTVVDLFQAQLQRKGLGLRIGRGQCVEQYGQGEAYLPILEALSRLAHEPGGRRVVEVLRRYAPTWLAQLPALLGSGERRELQATVQGTTQQRMLRELAEALEALAVERPLILILEDLHWSDVSTLEVLAYVGQRRDHARLLILGTYRPIEVILQGHRLKGVKQELETHGQCTELRLKLFTVGDVNAYLTARFANASLLPTLAAEVHRRTEGNALFMVNLVETWVRQEVITHDGQWQGQEPPTVNHTPETVRQMIEKQLERLGRQEQQLLETASVAGTEFTVAAVTAGLKENLDAVEDRCEALAVQGHFLEERGIAEWPDGTVSGRYGFRHALYQNVLYDRLAEMRRARLHRLIGEQLASGYGEQALDVAAELAVHFELGRDYRRAVQHLQQAGQNATQRSAYVEAISHLTKGLELLQTLPDTLERSQQELMLQSALGRALMATKGYAAPEVGKVYSRARELCSVVGETPQLFPVLWGLCAFYMVRGELQTTSELGKQMLQVAQSLQDPALLREGHHIAGQVLYFRGEIIPAREHLERAIALYDPLQHHTHAFLYGHDSGVACLGYSALVLWYLGYPDHAVQRSHDALTLAQRLSHPYSLGHASTTAARLYQLRQEGQATQERAETLISLSTAQGFGFLSALGTILRGWALAKQGQAEAGIIQIHQGLTAVSAMGAELYTRAHFLALLAEAYGRTGRYEKALNVLAEALALVDKTGERYYEAELYRLRGELSLQQESMEQRAKSTEQKSKKLKLQSQIPDSHGEAETCFLKALDVARQQQAKSLELRAIMSLVRLRQQQANELRAGSTEQRAGSTKSGVSSKEQEQDSRAQLTKAHNMLSKVYNWFTEGFDTKDLQEAKALLEELRER